MCGKCEHKDSSCFVCVCVSLRGCVCVCVNYITITAADPNVRGAIIPQSCSNERECALLTHNSTRGIPSRDPHRHEARRRRDKEHVAEQGTEADGGRKDRK